MKEHSHQMILEFFTRHTGFLSLKQPVQQACALLIETFQRGGKLLICGNGGSCADSEHIVGELMKGFLQKRPLPNAEQMAFARLFGPEGAEIAGKLQGGLPAISLSAHTALNSAFSNDVDPRLVYAQQVWGYAKEGDILLGISTSGNAENVCCAAMAAKVRGAKVLALTGRDGGRLAELADCSLIAPEQETYRVQEVHLAVYHLLCAVVESEFFN